MHTSLPLHCPAAPHPQFLVPNTFSLFSGLLGNRTHHLHAINTATMLCALWDLARRFRSYHFTLIAKIGEDGWLCCTDFSKAETHSECFWLNPWITRNLNSRQSLAHTPTFLFPESENHREWLTHRGHFLSTQLSQHLLSTYFVLALCWHPRKLTFPALGKALLPWISPIGICSWRHRNEAEVAHLTGEEPQQRTPCLPLPAFLKAQLKWTFPIPVSLSPILTMELW